LLIYTFYKQRNSKTIQGTDKSEAQWEKARGEMIKILRLKHLSMSTERTYIGCVKSFCKYLKFHSPRHIDGTHVAGKDLMRVQSPLDEE